MPAVTRIVKFIRQGDKGSDAVRYWLIPSVSTVVLQGIDSGDGTPAPATVSCRLMRQVGDDSPAVIAAPGSVGLTISYALVRQGTAETVKSYRGGSVTVPTNTEFTAIEFYLYRGSQLIDIATISITRDGEQGGKGNQGDAAVVYEIVTDTDILRPTDDSINISIRRIEGADAVLISLEYLNQYGLTMTARINNNDISHLIELTSDSQIYGFTVKKYDTLHIYLWQNGISVAEKHLSVIADGDKGDKGDDAIQNYITADVDSIPANSKGEPNIPTKNITVKQWQRVGNNTAMNTAAYRMAGYTVLNGVKTSFGQLNWGASFTFTAGTASGKDGFLIELLNGSDVIYSLTIPIIRTGASIRGPQSWADCAVGYSFQAGNANEEYKDIVLYDGAFYSCIKSHTKTADNHPLSTLDNNNKYWQVADKVDLIAANVLFGEHGFFGDAIISKGWMISANGTIDGTEYEKGATYVGTMAYSIFNGSSPEGADISIYNNSASTTIASTAETVNKATVYLESGKVYRLTCVGSTDNVSYPLYVRLVNVNTGELKAPVNINSTSSVTRYGSVLIQTTGNYHIQLYHTTGAAGKVTSCILVEKCFAPYYALNLKTGKGYFNRVKVKGTVNASLFYSGIKTLTSTPYTIDPETEPYNWFLVDENSGSFAIYLPKAADYEGLEINIFVRHSSWTSAKMVRVYIVDGDYLCFKDNVYTILEDTTIKATLENIKPAYSQLTGPNSLYCPPNQVCKFKAIGGKWYAVDGIYTGE